MKKRLISLQDVAEKRIPIMMCANKTDLREEATALVSYLSKKLEMSHNNYSLQLQGRRCVSTDEGDKLAREHSAIFIETSAKDGSNVIDAIVQLSRYSLLLFFHLQSAPNFSLQRHVLVRGRGGQDLCSEGQR